MANRISTTDLALMITSGNAAIVEGLKALTAAINTIQAAPNTNTSVPSVSNVVPMTTAKQPKAVKLDYTAKALENAKAFAATSGDTMAVWALTNKVGKVFIKNFRASTVPSAVRTERLYTVTPKGVVTQG